MKDTRGIIKGILSITRYVPEIHPEGVKNASGSSRRYRVPPNNAYDCSSDVGEV